MFFVPHSAAAVNTSSTGIVQLHMRVICVGMVPDGRSDPALLVEALAVSVVVVIVTVAMAMNWLLLCVITVCPRLPVDGVSV